MRRLLVALVWFVAAIWLLRLLGGTWGRAAAQRVRRAGSARQLVRDRICDTFIPRDRALVLTAGDQTYYFCSAACRARHV